MPSRVIVFTPVLLTAMLAATIVFYVAPNITSDDIKVTSKYAQWNPYEVKYDVITKNGIYKSIYVKDSWEVSITIKSTGSAPAKITGILLNHRDIDLYTPKIIYISRVDGNPQYLNNYKITLDSGESAKITILIPFDAKSDGISFTHGNLVDVRIFTQTKEKALSVVVP